MRHHNRLSRLAKGALIFAMVPPCGSRREPPPRGPRRTALTPASSLELKGKGREVNLTFGLFMYYLSGSTVHQMLYRQKIAENPCTSPINIFRKSSSASSTSSPTISPPSEQGTHCGYCLDPCCHPIPETKP